MLVFFLGFFSREGWRMRLLPLPVGCVEVVAVLSTTKKSAFGSKLSIFFRRPPNGCGVEFTSPESPPAAVLLLSVDDWLVAADLVMME